MREEEDFEAALTEEAEATTDRANALYGATGAGKSTLLNAIFGEQVAETGVGEPVTDKTELYVNAAGTLAVYDGAGLEIGDKSPIRDIARRLGRNRKGDLAALIHVAWYCVNSRTDRLEEGQRNVIEKIAAHGIPVVLVLTKVNVRDGQVDPAAQALADAIENMKLPIVTGRPVMTSAVDDEFNGTGQYGLESLLDVTYSVVPEAQRIALASAQKIDLSIKARYARSWIAGAVAFAGGVGATPIPLADAALLVPAQAALMAKIAGIYDIPKQKAAELIGATPVAAAAGGKIAAANLIKLVPGVGLMISAGVAAGITAVLGESWRLTTEKIFKGDIDLNDTEKLINFATMFADNVKNGTGAREGSVASPVTPGENEA